MPLTLEAEAVLTAQNQITIPAPIRQALKLHGGKSRVKFQLQRGKIIVSRVEAPAQENEDPALKPFLNLLTKDIEQHPKRIKPFPIELLKRAHTLVKGVKVDLDAPLTGED